MLQGRWPQLRAGAIALVIAIGLVEGCPLPPPSAVDPWQEPIVSVVRPVRDTLIWPFEWIFNGLRVYERWSLFQGAPRDRYRLEIAGKRDGAWQLVFKAGDPEHAEYANILMTERVRGAWMPTDHPPSQFGAFREWMAGRVLADHPEFTAARMWFERIVLDRGVLRPTGVYVMPFERSRAPAGSAK